MTACHRPVCVVVGHAITLFPVPRRQTLRICRSIDYNRKTYPPCNAGSAMRSCSRAYIQRTLRFSLDLCLYRHSLSLRSTIIRELRSPNLADHHLFPNASPHQPSPHPTYLFVPTTAYRCLPLPARCDLHPPLAPGAPSLPSPHLAALQLPTYAYPSTLPVARRYTT